MTITEHPTRGLGVNLDPQELAAQFAVDTDVVHRLELALGYPFSRSEPVAAIRADVRRHLDSRGLPDDRLDDLVVDVLERLEWIAVDLMTDIGRLDSVIAARSTDRPGALVIDVNIASIHHHHHERNNS